MSELNKLYADLLTGKKPSKQAKQRANQFLSHLVNKFSKVINTNEHAAQVVDTSFECLLLLN
jgi:hypothetical protein